MIEWCGNQDISSDLKKCCFGSVVVMKVELLEGVE